MTVFEATGIVHVEADEMAVGDDIEADEEYWPA